MEPLAHYLHRLEHLFQGLEMAQIRENRLAGGGGSIGLGETLAQEVEADAVFGRYLYGVDVGGRGNHINLVDNGNNLLPLQRSLVGQCG